MKPSHYLLEIKSLRFYIAYIVIVLCTSYLFYAFAKGDTIIALGKEDGLFEWLTSLFYFISFFLLVLTFKKNRNVFIVLLSMVMFFGAGEEISWGQRIFGIATPDNISKINVQHEFNIHNLAIFDGKQMNGEPKKGFSRFLEMDLLFKLFTCVFGILLPFCVYHFKPISKLTQKLKVPVPPITIGLFFAISWFLLKLSLSGIPLENNQEHYWRIFMAGPEIAECVGSFIMMAICFYFYSNRNKDIMGRDFKQINDW